MYNLQSSTGETQQAGIGKGEAQVFDNQDYMAREGRAAQFAQQDKLQKQKQAADKQDDLMKLIASSAAVKGKQGDIPKIVAMNDDLRNSAYKAMGVNGGISNADYIDIMTKANALKMYSEASANQRELIEAAKSKKGNYYASDLKRLDELMNKEGEHGAEVYLEEAFDPTQYVRQNIKPLMESALNTGDYGTAYEGETVKLPSGEDYVRPKRADLIANEIASNPRFKRAISEDFYLKNGRMPSSDDEVIAFGAEKYVNELPAFKVKNRPPSFATAETKRQAGRPNLSYTVKDDTGRRTITLDYTNVPMEEKIQTFNIKGRKFKGVLGDVDVDPDGNIEGAWVIPELTDIDKFNIQENRIKASAADEADFMYEARVPGPKFSDYKTVEEFKNARKEYIKKLPSRTYPKYKQVPVITAPQYVDAVEAKKFATQKYKVDLDKFIKTGDANATVFNIDDKQKEEPKQKEEKPLLSVKKLNEMRGTKYTIEQAKKDFPNYNVVE